jgi:LuxR family maltose regulon positive regulatory protein
MARIRQAQGDLAGAVELLDEAEHLYNGDFSPNVRPVSALKTRVWIAQGKLGEALGWAREQGLSSEDDLNYLREFEHITLARVLLAQYKSDGLESQLREAIGVLERLLTAAEEGGRTGSVIEILVLQALAHQTAGDMPAAGASLERALTLAEPEGYIRIFLDEGAGIAPLLSEAARQGVMPSFTGKLLATVGANEEGHAVALPILAASPQALVEPLSQRELEILHLLQTELSVPEIASELVIAASTVRSHTKSIYSKLDVNNRRAAVKRAAELKLI